MVNRVSPPDQVTLERITVERVNLYCHVPPQGGEIPVSVELFQVEDSIPIEYKIKWAVKRLKITAPGAPQGCRRIT